MDDWDPLPSGNHMIPTMSSWQPNEEAKDHRDFAIDSDEDREDEQLVKDLLEEEPSDAILTCPSCFTMLCFHSTRHSKYKNQYYAKKASNVKIDTKQSVPFTGDVLDKEKVLAAVCAECEAVVAAFISEDAASPHLSSGYHFFNVIAEAPL